RMASAMPCLRAASTASRTASSSAAATASFCLPQVFTLAIKSSKFMVQHLVLSFFSSATGRDTPSYVKIITRYVPRVKGAGPDAGRRGEGPSYYKRRIQGRIQENAA